MDEEGYVTYCGRGDEMLKVAGSGSRRRKWRGVCSSIHRWPRPSWSASSTSTAWKPRAYVVPRGAKDGLEETLRAHVRDRLDA
jgi:hypothetical protein